MKKIVSILLAALCFSALSNAVPAYPGLIRHTQPDGSVVQVRLHGDEYCHWVTDASGKVLEKDAKGFYRPGSEASLRMRKAAAAVRRSAFRSRVPAKAGIASGQKRFLVILVEFSDVHFASSTANADFNALLNEHNYSVNGGTGSARDFYYENSCGLFEPLFDVFGPVTLSNTQAYYGGNDSYGNDKYPQYAVRDGCNGLNSQIDFSRYDNDGDGKVDLVFMYYAGQGEADGGSEDCIWPHQWELSSGSVSLTLDGKTIDSYACTNEIVGYGTLEGKMCGIGTACHEFGHAMGLPDFYDTDYTDNDQSAGMFFFSTMDSGSYNNEGRTPPYFTMEERILLGWLQESSIQEITASGSYTLPSVSQNVAYKTATDQDGEYFVYECRGENGWDAALESYGLIVTHVDKSSRTVKIIDGSGYTRNVTASSLWSNWEQYNSINENGSHPCCYIVPSSGQRDLLFGHFLYSGNYYFDDSKAPMIPFPGNPAITSYRAESWNGVESDVRLSNIAYSNNQVTFTATVPSNTLNYNVIANPGNGVYTAGSYFALNVIESGVQPVSGVSWYFDDEPVSASSVLLSAGTHTVEAHLALSDGSSKILELSIEAR